MRARVALPSVFPLSPWRRRRRGFLRRGPVDAVYDAKHRHWRESRAKDLQSPTGWLTVAGLFFLKTGPNVVGIRSASDVALPMGSAPTRVGTITRDVATTWFEPAPGADVTIDDARVSSRTELKSSTRLKSGRVSFFLHASGDRLAVRVRDPEHDLRKSFRGLRWFPIRAEWRIAGKFVPYAAPKPILVQNVLGDIEQFTSPGEVSFQVNRQTVTLQAVRSGQRLWFIFSDATAAKEHVSDPLPLRRRAVARRHRRARFQSRVQPTVRLQPVHHLPAATF